MRCGWVLYHFGWEDTEPWEGGFWAWVGWVARGGFQWQAEGWGGPGWRQRGSVSHW